MSGAVAVITTSYPRFPGDAAGHFVQTEARRIAQEGHRVITWAPGAGAIDRGNPEVHWMPHDDCFGIPGALARLRARPTRVLGAYRFVRATRRGLREHAPFRKVIAHFIVPCAWPIAFDLHAPLEVVAHGSDVELLVRLNLAGIVVRTLLDRGARFRFVSERLRCELVRHSSDALVENSYVAPSPIDISDAPSRDVSRARLSVPEAQRLVVICGRLIAQKRIDAAVAHATREEPGARIVVVGDGPERGRLEGRFPGCHFVGHLPRARALEWITASDLLVSASRREGAPTVIREARALGVPVLAEPCGDVADWAARDPGIRLIAPARD